MAQPQLPVWLAPMVDGSELAFRMLCRKHGATTAYTPMVRARQVLAAQGTLPQPCAADRPLVVQLCGNEPSTLAEAVNVLSAHYGDQLDGIDLNLGCPQQIAEKERIGAFLADREPDTAVACVRAMAAVAANGLRISCKIRLTEGDASEVSVADATLAFARRLEAAGCGLLAVHCRPRTAKHDGSVDLATARALVAGLAIPVVVNGGVGSAVDARATLEATGAHAVMAAQGFLKNPRMLQQHPPRTVTTPDTTVHETAQAHAIALAAEYLEFAAEYPPPAASYVRKHLRWILRHQLMADARPEGGGGRSDGAFATFSAAERDWRAKLWQYISREHLLTTVNQFRQVRKSCRHQFSFLFSSFLFFSLLFFPPFVSSTT